MLTAMLVVGILPGCVVATTSSDRGGGGFGLLLFAVPLLFVVIAVARRSRTRRTRRWSGDSESPRPSRALLRAELSVLADDVVRFEPRVALCEAARDDFDAATQRYRVAQAALDEAEDDLDLVRLQRLVDEATWSMTRARALVEGRTPPEPPDKLQQRGGHGEPAIQLDEDERPTYVGSRGDFRSGWFGVGGGVFGGLLLGTVLNEFGEDPAEHEGHVDDFGGATDEW